MAYKYNTLTSVAVAAAAALTISATSLHLPLELEESRSRLPSRYNPHKRTRNQLHAQPRNQSNPPPQLDHPTPTSSQSHHQRRHRIRTLEQSNQTRIDAFYNSSDTLADHFPLIYPFIPTDLYSSRIINGNVAPKGRYPYAASLVDRSGRHVCGGTLIAPDILLTAGHCSGYFAAVQLDRHDISKQRGGDFMVVEKHITHPQYGSVILNDFAIAKLYGASRITPVKINMESNEPRNDDYLTVMGWGVTQEGLTSSASDVLREVNVQYMTNRECDASSGSYQGDYVSYMGYIESNMMCAWNDQMDACQGDSGGPLIQRGEDSDSDVQVGIVSWGLGCAMKDFPGVYARTSEEISWIQAQVCALSISPPSSFGCTGIRQSVATSKALIDITVAIELVNNPDDTSWILEPDPDSRTKADAFVDGENSAPFGTYSNVETVATPLKIKPNESYRLTLLDRQGNGLGKDAEKGLPRFRICYGSMTGQECIESDTSVVCEGTGNFGLSKSITCYIERVEIGATTTLPNIEPTSIVRIPTFAPFKVPLFLESDNHQPNFDPTLPPSSGKPSITSSATPSAIPSSKPSNSLQPSLFVKGSTKPPTSSLSASPTSKKSSKGSTKGSSQAPSNDLILNTTKSSSFNSGGSIRGNTFFKFIFFASLVISVSSVF